MRLYLDHSSKPGGGIVGNHVIYVAPAADKAGQACPPEWVDTENKPVAFELRFVGGICDTAGSGVPDSVAKYMLDRGLAMKRQPLFRAI